MIKVKIKLNDWPVKFKGSRKDLLDIFKPLLELADALNPTYNRYAGCFEFIDCEAVQVNLDGVKVRGQLSNTRQADCYGFLQLSLAEVAFERDQWLSAIDQINDAS